MRNLIRKDTKSKPYPTIESELHPTREAIDWSTCPGQFTKEEKIARLKAAVEDTTSYTQDEVKAFVATWRRK
jgi:hypothetical protein